MFFFHVLAGLKVIGHDEQRWPCQSSHRITVSLDGVKPLTITLPYPILMDNLKATLRRKDGVVDVVAVKAQNDLWPEDVIRDQFKWDTANLESWTDMKAIDIHLTSQFGPDGPASRESSALTGIRLLLSSIFTLAIKEKKLLFELRSKGPEETKEWLVRVHLPVRTSPRGAPVLLLTALDQRQIARLERESKWNKQQGEKDHKRIFCSRDLPEKFEVVELQSAEEVELFRHILRLNSTKIEPTTWQKKNLPQGGDSPWLATFIRPLYLDKLFYYNQKPAGTCRKCNRKDVPMKKCSRCKTASYCSVECQRADWPLHKLSCSWSCAI